MSRILSSVKTDDVVRVSAKNSGKRNIYIYIPAKNRVCAGTVGLTKAKGLVCLYLLRLCAGVFFFVPAQTRFLAGIYIFLLPEFLAETLTTSSVLTEREILDIQRVRPDCRYRTVQVRPSEVTMV